MRQSRTYAPQASLELHSRALEHWSMRKQSANLKSSPADITTDFSRLRRSAAWAIKRASWPTHKHSWHMKRRKTAELALFSIAAPRLRCCPGLLEAPSRASIWQPLIDFTDLIDLIYSLFIYHFIFVLTSISIRPNHTKIVFTKLDN